MKNVIIALLLTASCFAQTAQPKPVASSSPQCVTIIKCRAIIKAQENERALALEQMETAKVAIDDLQRRNVELKKKYDDSIAVLDVLATQIKGQHLNLEQQKALAGVEAGKALDLGTSLEKDIDVIFKYAVKLQQDYKAKADAYDSLVDRYNSTLQQANNLINAQNARLARQQQVNNALAIMSPMPKPQYVPLPPPPVFTNTNINCISNTSGSYTYTNCH